jgi:phosphate transport system substrate-binding protein
MYPRKLCFALCLLVLFSPASAQDPQSIHLIGVGSSSPLALYSAWFREFREQHPNVRFSYMPSGSSDGIDAVSAGKADFGTTEIPLTSNQLARAHILQFPVAVEALVPVYNLPGVIGPLKFSPRVLARIYLGEIKRWNDPALLELNPKAQLPAANIVLFHSSAGRGAGYVWSDFLSKASAEWRTRVGTGANVRWPAGAAVYGNGNLAASVKQTPNSFGYAWFANAVKEELAYGSVENQTGDFVVPDSSSVAAAARPKVIPVDFLISITDPPGERSYPVTSFTWLLVSDKLQSAEKQAALRQFLLWILSAGQNDAAAYGFVQLPPAIVTRELEALHKTGVVIH